MANPEHLARLLDCVANGRIDEWNNWRADIANLSDDELVDAPGGKLRKVDLSGAKLQDANLQFADLQFADLQRADLQDANLQFADLQFADLQRANLRGANLRGANLQFANLLLADLQGADLQKANLQGAIGVEMGMDIIGSSRIEATVREKELQQKVADLEQKIQFNQEVHVEKVTAEKTTEKIEQQRDEPKRELEEIKKELKEATQKNEMLESLQEEGIESIEKALKYIQLPNVYIDKENTILTWMFWSYIVLSIVSVVFLIVLIFDSYKSTAPFANLAPEFGLYVYLNHIAPKVVCLTLFSAFLTLANRSRRSIQRLQERKRQVELLRGALLAINELSDSPRSAVERVGQILDNLSSRAIDFTEGSSAHDGTEAHAKDDNVVISLDKLKGFIAK